MIRLDFDLDQGSDFEFTPNIRANISLPSTQNRLHFFINGEEGDPRPLQVQAERKVEVAFY